MKPVVYYTAFRDQSGYGMCARNYVLGLHKLGADIILRNVEFWRGDKLQFSKEIEDIYNNLITKKLPEKDWILIQHVTTDNYIYDERAFCHIGYTPFETDGLPSHWVLPMKSLDYIYVASEFNVETYSKYGIDKNKIKIIPHGVDTDKFSPDCDKIPLPDNIKNRFKFGMNCEWNPRKCPESIIEAYTRAFDKSDNTILIIKTFFQLDNEQFRVLMNCEKNKYITDTIAQIRDKVGKIDNAPDIMIMRKILSDEQMPMFYNSMDAMITVSRGEGAGLCSMESMASEKPVIATNWSGNLEFMNDDNSYLIDADIVRIPNTWLTKISRNYTGRQCWAEPKIDDLVNKLKDVYNNYDKAKIKAKKARQDMIDNYTWDKVCQKYYEELEKI